MHVAYDTALMDVSRPCMCETTKLAGLLNRVFSCDVITFEIMKENRKQKTAAILVYNEIGASMAIFTK